MNFDFLKLSMAALWLLATAFILGRDWPDDPNRPIPLTKYEAAAVAVAGALYNLARWWRAGRARVGRRAVPVNPLAVRRIEGSEPEPQPPNPDFDFVKLPDAPPELPTPSANGDRR